MEKCSFCGFKNIKFLFSMGNYKLFHCEKCGLVFFSPLPSDLVIDNYYFNYLEKYHNKFLIENNKILEYKKLRWGKRIEKIKTFKKAPASILDIGCSTGIFLTTARENGYSTTGVEISKQEAKVARATFKIKVFTKSLEKLNFKKESFDIITMWDVFEHVKDPIGLIQESKRILKKNGILAISTINWNAMNRKMFKDKWRFLIPIEHLYYYNKPMLKDFFTKNGFEVLNIKTSFAPQAFLEGFIRIFKQKTPDERIFVKNQSISFLKIKDFITDIVDKIVEKTSYGDLIEIYLKKI